MYSFDFRKIKYYYLLHRFNLLFVSKNWFKDIKSESDMVLQIPKAFSS